jgi:hypothetical protein
MDIIDKKVNTTEVMPSVPLHKVLTLSKRLEKLSPETPITLELILTALFPTVWDNIKKYATDCYTNGYLQGLKDAKNED